MLIKVNTLDKEMIEVNIEPTDNLQLIKKKVEEVTGCPTYMQIMFDPEMLKLDNEKTVEENNIQEGTVLSILLMGGKKCDEHIKELKKNIHYFSYVNKKKN